MRSMLCGRRVPEREIIDNALPSFVSGANCETERDVVSKLNCFMGGTKGAIV